VASTVRTLRRIGALDKVLIIGYPHTGKTTLSARLIRPVLHLDGYVEKYDSERLAAEQAMKFFKQSQWVAEGCLGFRLLTKGLDPDLIVFCTKTIGHGKWEMLIPGQKTMWRRYLGDQDHQVDIIYHG